MVLKEKAGIERALLSGELTIQGRTTVPVNGSLISLSALVQLREVVAQQEGYLDTFYSFAPSWAVTQYRSQLHEPCVAATARMRADLLETIHQHRGHRTHTKGIEIPARVIKHHHTTDTPTTTPTTGACTINRPLITMHD